MHWHLKQSSLSSCYTKYSIRPQNIENHIAGIKIKTKIKIEEQNDVENIKIAILVYLEVKPNKKGGNLMEKNSVKGLGLKVLKSGRAYLFIVQGRLFCLVVFATRL